VPAGSVSVHDADHPQESRRAFIRGGQWSPQERLVTSRIPRKADRVVRRLRTLAPLGGNSD
jgi:hypothetical protein